MGESIYESENYEVVVGDGADYEGMHYLVVNKRTRVVEVESRLYPQSVAYCDQLSDSLDEMEGPDGNKAILDELANESLSH